MEFKYLLFSVEDKVATVTIHRPDKGNSLAPEVLEEIEALFTEISKRQDVNVVVLTGGEKYFSAGFDLTIIRISDPAEEELPDVGMACLRDPETDQMALIDTGSGVLKERWRRFREEQRSGLSDLLNRSGVDLVDITTDGSVSEPLVHLFEKRRRRR